MNISGALSTNLFRQGQYTTQYPLWYSHSIQAQLNNLSIGLHSPGQFLHLSPVHYNADAKPSVFAGEDDDDDDDEERLDCGVYRAPGDHLWGQALLISADTTAHAQKRGDVS